MPVGSSIQSSNPSSTFSWIPISFFHIYLLKWLVYFFSIVSPTWRHSLFISLVILCSDPLVSLESIIFVKSKRSEAYECYFDSLNALFNDFRIFLNHSWNSWGDIESSCLAPLCIETFFMSLWNWMAAVHSSYMSIRILECVSRAAYIGTYEWLTGSIRHCCTWARRLIIFPWPLNLCCADSISPENMAGLPIGFPQFAFPCFRGHIQLTRPNRKDEHLGDLRPDCSRFELGPAYPWIVIVTPSPGSCIWI